MLDKGSQIKNLLTVVLLGHGCVSLDFFKIIAVILHSDIFSIT